MKVNKQIHKQFTTVDMNGITAVTSKQSLLPNKTVLQLHWKVFNAI